MTEVLELVGVSVHYGAMAALQNMSIKVLPGESAAIMGPNGAGKSTVLKAVMGLTPMSTGAVYFRGRPLSRTTHEIVKNGIAFVPQGRRIFPHLTIEENLEVSALHVKEQIERRRRLAAVMELFPMLDDKRRDLAGRMSGGQQQMLALGRGLMAQPEVLLLDEPTLGLAPIVVKEVFEKISSIRERLRTSIVVVEHNIKGALDIVDRAYVLAGGRLVFEGTPQSVRETGILNDVFLGKADPAPDAEEGP